MATLEQSLPYKDWIVGVGLDSDEKDNPPVKFKAVFARARAEGYRLTMHCDVDQEDSTRHIRQTLFDCVHEGAVVHTFTVPVAAALAWAEREGGVGGRDFLTALALGVASTHPLRFFRTATAGAFGAAGSYPRTSVPPRDGTPTSSNSHAAWT